VDEKPAGTAPWDAFGGYLRNQRQLAQLSLRQLADLTKVSNPYLSQIERGLHRPSIAIIKALAEALNLSTSDLLAHAADIASDEQAATTTEGAIRNDPLLNAAQKGALLAVYRSMVDADGSSEGSSDGSAADADGSPPGAADAPAPTGTAPKKAAGTRSRSASAPKSRSRADTPAARK
jgi:transcriptional regulator with XRE-family HTH domain